MKKVILYSFLALSLGTFLHCTKESTADCLPMLLVENKMKPFQGEQLIDCTPYMYLIRWENKEYYEVELPCIDYWPPIILSCEKNRVNWTDDVYVKFGFEAVFIKVVGIQK